MMKNIKQDLKGVEHIIVNGSEFNVGIQVGYARVSSKEQAINSHALEQQIQRLKDAGTNVIIYDVQSGKKDDRPGLLKVMGMVRASEIVEVVVTRLDRLGRSVLLIRKNIGIFQDANVNLRVLDQLIDLNTPQGMFMINLLASLAEMEVDQLSERVKHGKAHRRQQKAACECMPFGYSVENNRYQLDHTPFLCLLSERPSNYADLSLYSDNEDDIKKLPGITKAQLAKDCIDIFLKKKGASQTVKELCHKYGIKRTSSKRNGNDKIFHWSQLGLKRWLTNPVLSGHTVYNKRIKTATGQRKELPPKDWEIIYDTHPNERLVSIEEAEDIRQILEFNSSRSGPFLFNDDPSNSDSYEEFAYQRSIVYCAECHSKCITKTRHGKNKKYHYYACRHAGKGCDNLKGTRKDLIERALIDHLLQQSLVLEARDANPNNPSSEFPVKSEKLKRLEMRLAKLEEITDFDSEIIALKEKTKREIEEEMNPFSTKAIDTKTIEEIIKSGNNLLIWYNLSADDKVAIYSKLLQRIIVSNGSVTSIILHTDS